MVTDPHIRGNGILRLTNAALPVFLWGKFSQLSTGHNKVEQEAIELGFFLQHGEVVAQIQLYIEAFIHRLLQVAVFAIGWQH